MAGLNLAMAGIPWGAAEIGGFVTPEVQDDEFRELGACRIGCMEQSTGCYGGLRSK